MSSSKNKIKSIKEVSVLSAKHGKAGKKIALITGCFDILHIGHIEVFHQAKQFADKLVIGLENDKTIKLTKGSNRPINSQETRAFFLSKLIDVDFVFVIEDVCDYSKNNTSANKVYERILKEIHPHYLVTSKSADKYWRKKEHRIKKLGGSLLLLESSNTISSSKIIDKLVSEF